MNCELCNRPLSTDRAQARRHGAECHKRYLESLPPEERLKEEMRGYAWTEKAPGVYLVISPEHNAYTTTVNSCDCPAHQQRGGICKHIRWMRQENPQAFAEWLARIEAEMSVDFGQEE